MAKIDRPQKDNCFNFDEFLPTIGDFGLYQKGLLVYLMPFFLFWAFTYLTQIFLIIVPEKHWCRIPELQHLSPDEQQKLGIPKTEDDEYDTCRMYDTNFTLALEKNMTEANENWPTKQCKDWNYDKGEVPYESIATEHNWVCDNKHLGPWTVTIYFSGSCIGGLVFGYVSDHLGRLPAAMLSNVCVLIGGSLSAFCNSFLLFSLARFVIGLGFDNCVIPTYVLIIECVAPKYRAPITNFSLTMLYFPAACALPWIAYACNDWHKLALATSIPVILCLILYPVLQESPRWLLSVGKIDKAMLIIRRIAKVNGKTVPETELLEFEKCSIKAFEEHQTKKKYTLFDLFKSMRMCLLTLDLVTLWMIMSLVYDAHVRAIIDIGPDVFITFSVASAVEVPACLVPMFLLNSTGRKCMALIVFLGCGAGSIIAALLTSKWQMAASALFGRFCASIAFNICMQWAAEILPTVVRGQGVAFIHLMGFVCSLVSPFVVHSKHHSSSAPMLIIGLLSIIGAILVMFLPETTNMELPETTAEAEQLSKSQKIFSFKKPAAA